MDFESSQTKKNLQTAFAGESMATNKYTYFASQAKKDGYVGISEIFTETAGNEREHAKMWFKYLEGGSIRPTAENLAEAAAGENEEWTHMYKEKRYRALIARLESGEVFKRDDVVVWKCQNCGHLHIGKEAPEVCPVCAHPRSYFVQQVVNY